jgi:hypothetical protein
LDSKKYCLFKKIYIFNNVNLTLTEKAYQTKQLKIEDNEQINFSIYYSSVFYHLLKSKENGKRLTTKPEKQNLSLRSLKNLMVNIMENISVIDKTEHANCVACKDDRKNKPLLEWKLSEGLKKMVMSLQEVQLQILKMENLINVQSQRW